MARNHRGGAGLEELCYKERFRVRGTLQPMPCDCAVPTLRPLVPSGGPKLAPGSKTLTRITSRQDLVP